MFSRGGKCGGCTGRQRVLTWGDPAEEIRWEVSRGCSSGKQAGGPRVADPNKLKTGKLEGATDRTDEEPIGSSPASRFGADLVLHPPTIFLPGQLFKLFWTQVGSISFKK